MNARVWERTREQTPKVDTQLINKVQLYNKASNSVVATLDYIDPYKGKIAGIAGQEISFKTSYDPAAYKASRQWGKQYVNQLWWDVSQTRWLDYEQGDIAFRASNWGKAFPGSTIYCWEWTESLVPPSQYSDPINPLSFVRDVNQFNEIVYIDVLTN